MADVRCAPRSDRHAHAALDDPLVAGEVAHREVDEDLAPGSGGAAQGRVVALVRGELELHRARGVARAEREADDLAAQAHRADRLAALVDLDVQARVDGGAARDVAMEGAATERRLRR